MERAASGLSHGLIYWPVPIPNQGISIVLVSGVLSDLRVDFLCFVNDRRTCALRSAVPRLGFLGDCRIAYCSRSRSGVNKLTRTSREKGNPWEGVAVATASQVRLKDIH